MATKTHSETIRILLVEDDEDDYLLTRELLAEAGGKFKLDWAKNFKSGLDAINTCSHDAYLLDYNLGAKNGIELVRQALATGCKNPLILLTGVGDHALAMEALDAGAADYLIKGAIDADNLERTIRFAIQQARYTEELEEKVHERTAELEKKIAEREQAEQTVRESEERFRALFAAAPMAVFVCDTNAIIQYYNDRAVELWGREPECGVEQHCGSVKLWLPDGKLLPHVQSPVVGVLSTGVPANNVEVFIERPDGSRLPVLVNFAALRDAQGKVTGAITSFIDITERKEAEQASARLAAIVTYSQDAIVSKNLEGILTSWNRGAEHLFGYSAEEAVGKSVTMLIPDDHLDEEPDILARIRRGEAIEHYETVRRRKDGTLFDISLTVSPIRDASGTIIGASKIARDITARRAEDVRLALFARLGELTRTAEEPDALRYEIASSVCENLGAHRCLFNEIDLDAGTEMVKSDYFRHGESLAGTHKLSQYSPEAQEQMRSGVTVVNNDSKTDERTAKLHKKAYAPTGKRAYIAVPLMRGGRWVATFWVSDDKPRVWSDEEVRLIESVGERAWLAVERLRNEAALRESEERFSRFMRHLPGLAWIKDTDGRYVFANEAAVLAFGTPPERLYGKTDDEVFPPDVAARFKENDERAMMEGTGLLQTVESLEQEDGVHHSLVTKFPIAGPGGQISLVGGMAVDITERQRMEEALRESEEKFRILSEAAPALIWFDDPDGNCLYVNRHYLEFAGKKADELEGAQWHLVLHPDDVDAYLNDLHTALRERLPFYGRVRAQRHDGEWRWLESFAQPLFAADGAYLGLVGVSPDITDSVEAEQVMSRYREELEERVVERTLELVQTNNALKAESSKRLLVEKEAVRLLKQILTIQEDERRRIARDLHDDLGQKLTALRLKLENTKELCNDQVVCDAIDEIQAIARRLDTDVGFLAWELRPAVLDDMGLAAALETYVREWSRFSSIKAGFHVAGLEKERLPGEIEINLYRIVQEALNNANKYAKPSTVSVMLKRRKYDVMLIIEDDGVGFNTEKVPKSKSGLGLPGMRERADLIGGTLNIESSPGSGTTIFVRAPLRISEVSSAPA